MINTLCYVGIYALESFIAYWYFSKLFERRRPVWMTVLLIVAAHTGLFGFSRLNNFVLNAAAFVSANAVILAVGYHCGWKNVLFHPFLMNVICTCTELLVNIWLTSVYGDFFEFYDNDVALVLLCTLSKLLYFSVMAMFAYFIRAKRHERGENGPVIALLAIVPTVSVLTLLVMFNLFDSVVFSRLDVIFLSVVAFALVAANVGVFLAYDYLRQLMSNALQAELALSRQQSNNEYYRMLDEQYEAQRILIHDMKHHLSVLRQSLQNDEPQRATAYLEKLIDSPELNSKTKWCSHPTLNIILRYYQEECRKLGIQFSVGIRSNTIDFMEPTDITALFGNALQNALEAAGPSEEKAIELSINRLSPSENVVVVISNSCAVPPEINANGGWLTTKENKEAHGIGLKSIQSVVAKYQGDFYSQYSSEQNRFELRMIFYSSKLTV